ncbi:hypothetical protein DFJ73DRAFT_338563 [Zopfochytrium polystomum]|nr:hypothetical protein DFJ73DRAFT_338563 [Zopfochytrium polystomum]
MPPSPPPSPQSPQSPPPSAKPHDVQPPPVDTVAALPPVSVRDPAITAEAVTSGESAGAPSPKEGSPAAPAPAKRPLAKKPNYFASRAFINVVKASIAYVLAFAWIFWDKTGTLFQSRTLSNIALAVIVISPAKTVGNFLDLTFLGVVAICVGALAWTLINLIAGTSYAGMAVLFFLSVYIFSYLRSLTERNFAIGVIGPFFSFLACASAAGLSGANTTNGQVFDSNYLLNVIYSFLLGTGISLAVNILIFPEFAEPAFRRKLGETLNSLSDLLVLSIRPFALGPAHFNDADSMLNRATAVATLRANLSALSKCLAETRAEVTYSRFSQEDREEMVEHVSAMAAQLFALETAFKDGMSVPMVAEGAVRFKESFSKVVESSLLRIEESCCRMISTCKIEIVGRRLAGAVGMEQDLESAATAGAATTERIQEDLLAIVQRQRELMQRGVVENVSHPLKPEDDKDLLDRHSVAYEAVTQVNFFGCALRELSLELGQLHALATDTSRAHRVRLHLPHFLPSFLHPLVSKKAAASKRAAQAAAEASAGATFRSVLRQLSKFFLSKQSIFALKCAIAVETYLLISFNERTVYSTWYLSSNVITLLVAVTPWVGQDQHRPLRQPYRLLPRSAVGLRVDRRVGHGAKRPWRVRRVGIATAGTCGCRASGLGIMAFVFALPMEHVYTNTRMAPLGLLALLSFSGGIIGPYLNRANPLYDAPATRLYKSVAVLSRRSHVCHGFATVSDSSGAGQTQYSCLLPTGSSILYPNLARQNLRAAVSRSLQGLSRYNTLIFDIAFSGARHGTNVPPPNVAKNLTQLRRTLLTLQALLQSLPPLLVFSSAEIRLEAKFPKADYAELVERMGRILDYLASAATSLRGKGFGREFGLYAIASAELVAARKQLFSATRLLFSSLPRRSKTRTRCRARFRRWCRCGTKCFAATTRSRGTCWRRRGGSGRKRRSIRTRRCSATLRAGTQGRLRWWARARGCGWTR